MVDISGSLRSPLLAVQSTRRRFGQATAKNPGRERPHRFIVFHRNAGSNVKLDVDMAPNIVKEDQTKVCCSGNETLEDKTNFSRVVTMCLALV